MSEAGAATPRVSYWQANLRLVAGCLAVWFGVSFGCGILLLDWLNGFQLGGAPLGFWFAQQGSIYVFVGLIFFYAWRMSALDAAYGVDEDSAAPAASTGEPEA